MFFAADQTFGPYRLLRKLGRGGFAEVWLAEQSGAAGFTRQVALKLVALDPKGDGMRADALWREGRIGSWLQSEAIVGVERILQEDDTIALAMEYVDGGTVTDLWVRLRALGLPMPISATLQIVLACARALHAAHHAIDPDGRELCVVHRDLKPSNVLLGHSGTVKVCDFGIAKATDDTNITGTGLIKGTTAYLAPELWENVRSFSPASDTFALGTLLVESVTLQRLHGGGSMALAYRRISTGTAEEDAAPLADHFPPLHELTTSLLRRDPRQRLAETGQIVQTLQALLDVWGGPDDVGVLLKLLDAIEAGEPVALPSHAVDRTWAPVWQRASGQTPVLRGGPLGLDGTWPVSLPQVESEGEELSLDGTSRRGPSALGPVGDTTRPRDLAASIPPAMNEPTAPFSPGASIPPVARSGSLPPVARSASMPPAARSASMPPAARSASMPPSARSALMSPAARSASMPPVARSASMPPAAPAGAQSGSGASGLDGSTQPWIGVPAGLEPAPTTAPRSPAMLAPPPDEEATEPLGSTSATLKGKPGPRRRAQRRRRKQRRQRAAMALIGLVALAVVGLMGLLWQGVRGEGPPRATDGTTTAAEAEPTTASGAAPYAPTPRAGDAGSPDDTPASATEAPPAASSPPADALESAPAARPQARAAREVATERPAAPTLAADEAPRKPAAEPTADALEAITEPPVAQAPAPTPVPARLRACLAASSRPPGAYVWIDGRRLEARARSRAAIVLPSGSGSVRVGMGLTPSEPAQTVTARLPLDGALTVHCDLLGDAACRIEASSLACP